LDRDVFEGLVRKERARGVQQHREYTKTSSMHLSTLLSQIPRQSPQQSTEQSTAEQSTKKHAG